MKLNTIAAKLLLLAGVPVLGLLLMAALVISNAQEQLERSRAIGSVESVAELARYTSVAVNKLQTERSLLSLRLGRVTKRAESELAEKEAGPTKDGALPLARAYESTQQARHELQKFTAQLDMSRLPVRLRDGLGAALRELESLEPTRELAGAKDTSLETVLRPYSGTNRELIRSLGALSELTDDGELIRLISSLVAVLELQERASIEHALLANVFAVGDFPPGGFKDFVTLLTEEETFVEVLKNNATSEQFAVYLSRMAEPQMQKPLEFRKRALNVIDGELAESADQWFGVQSEKVSVLGELATGLNEELKRRASAKQTSTRQAFFLTLGLSGLMVLLSAGMALFIGRRVTQGVAVLRDAAHQVAQGKSEVRVQLSSRDELETLGNAFNNMTEEIARGRDALATQARMSRDLEIAARIQSALLPPAPAHPEFEFAGRMRPADEVGGDFYDVLLDGDNRALWVTIGDVSGHGIPAGLVMLMTQSAFAAFFRANPLARPDEVIRGVNDLLNEQIGVRLRDDKYVTAMLLTYGGGGRFIFAGAHEWPLVWRAATGEIETIEAPGPWLGLVSDLDDIPVSSLRLDHGDILCLYSDGLIEARDPSGNLFDINRLRECIMKSANQQHKLSQVADAVLASVAAYADQREDDYTLLLVKRS